jgi:hypothetical protein
MKFDAQSKSFQRGHRKRKADVIAETLAELAALSTAIANENAEHERAQVAKVERRALLARKRDQRVRDLANGIVRKRGGRQPGAKNKPKEQTEGFILSAVNVRHYFDYDATTGHIFRAVTEKGMALREGEVHDYSVPFSAQTHKYKAIVVRKAGARVTTTFDHDREDPTYNHIRCRLKGNDYVGSHIAHLIMKGEWPTDLPEHDNGDKWDLRWENLIWR